MKIFKILAVALLLIGVSSCSESTTFNAEKCQQLEQKMRGHEDLTEADFNDMIDQMGAAVETLAAKKKELGDDASKQKEYATSKEGQEVLGAILAFGFYLDSHEKDLSPANIKKLAKLQKRFEEIEKENK